MLVVCSGCAQTYYVCMLWFKMLLSAVIPVHSVRVDSNLESCIESKTSGKRPPLMSVCTFSECTVQLLLGVACEACGSRPHCLVLALNGAMYSSLLSRTPCTIDGVYYSVQLDDTGVVFWCAATHGLVSNGICSYLAFASS